VLREFCRALDRRISGPTGPVVTGSAREGLGKSVPNTIRGALRMFFRSTPIWPIGEMGAWCIAAGITVAGFYFCATAALPSVDADMCRGGCTAPVPGQPGTFWPDPRHIVDPLFSIVINNGPGVVFSCSEWLYDAVAVESSSGVASCATQVGVPGIAARGRFGRTKLGQKTK